LQFTLGPDQLSGLNAYHAGVIEAGLLAAPTRVGPA
jgi:hypothetical protein